MSAERLRILAVEDEGLIAMELDDMLGDLGHEVIGPAATVESALRLLEGARPDAAVVDANLGACRQAVGGGAASRRASRSCSPPATSRRTSRHWDSGYLSPGNPTAAANSRTRWRRQARGDIAELIPSRKLEAIGDPASLARPRRRRSSGRWR